MFIIWRNHLGVLISSPHPDVAVEDLLKGHLGAPLRSSVKLKENFSSMTMSFAGQKACGAGKKLCCELRQYTVSVLVRFWQVL